MIQLRKKLGNKTNIQIFKEAIKKQTRPNLQLINCSLVLVHLLLQPGNKSAHCVGYHRHQILSTLDIISIGFYWHWILLSLDIISIGYYWHWILLGLNIMGIGYYRHWILLTLDIIGIGYYCIGYHWHLILLDTIGIWILSVLDTISIG